MSAVNAYRKIVVGTDGSALAEPTVARAAMLAAAEGADLVIVCAFSALSQADDAKHTGLGDTRTGVVMGREAATDALAAASAIAGGFGAAIEKAVLVEGEPAAALLEAARSYRADVIVLGAIRDVSIADRLLGTVASTVVRRAACEVLIVRPPVAWGDVSELEVPSSEV